MCTVSFISSKEGCFITSNRDEHISRPMAMQPEEGTINSIKVLFPKDPQAGGTWFAINEFGVVAVLLNGAFVKHERKPSYAKSRGLVVLDVIASMEPESTLGKMDLTEVEPFTLVLFDGDGLTEFRWDGESRHRKTLNPQQNHIWSSVTLYDERAIEQRNQLFGDFIATNNGISAGQIVDFHSNNHQDYENGFVIDRTTGLKTFSVTQVILQQEDAAMHHYDLLNGKEYHVPFSPKELVAIK